MFRRKDREQQARLVIDGQTYSVVELRQHACNVMVMRSTTQMEKGLAMSLVAALDEITHLDGPAHHEWKCPNCGQVTRARMADR